MSAAAMRYSTRCDFSDPGMTRSAVVLFSTPQAASVGAQKPGIRRELGIHRATHHRSSSGIGAC
jgi:hypothetical protein